MQTNSFTPWGPTYFVGPTTPVQVLATNNQNATSYRIRNLSFGSAYIGWDAPANPNNPPPQIGAVAPSQGVPSPNVIGMASAGIETFCLPANCWFLASIGNSFEVTPGEGM